MTGSRRRTVALLLALLSIMAAISHAATIHDDWGEMAMNPQFVYESAEPTEPVSHLLCYYAYMLWMIRDGTNAL